MSELPPPPKQNYGRPEVALLLFIERVIAHLMGVEPIERVYCSGYALRSEVSALRLRSWACKGLCGEQKGKALSGADLSLRSS